MKLGAEPKKVAILVGLLVVALAVYFFNSSSPSGAESISAAPRAAVQQPAAPTAAPTSPAQSGRTPQRQQNEFKPRIGAKRGEERTDPAGIDPTLRLDVLARLQAVNVEGTRRSIFDFGTTPAPKPDPAKIAEAKVKPPSPIIPINPTPAQPVDTTPPKPQPPPVPMKFFGYLTPQGQPQKRAFFVEGEEIHVVKEGDIVKRRYKIVRIGVNSVIVEDTQFGQQQTLPLLEEQPG